AVAVYLYIHCWIVGLLGKLQIAQKRQLEQPLLDFLRVVVVSLQVDSHDCDFNGSRRTKSHHLTYDVRGLERYARARQLPLDAAADSLAQISPAGRPFFKRDLDDGFARTSREQVNQIDRIAWRLPAHKIAAD